MKILITGDWHADHISFGVKRQEEIGRAIIDMMNYANDSRNSIDLFVFLGDLTDPDNTRSYEAIRKAHHAMRWLDCPSVWISGNHDVIEDGTGMTTLTPLEHAENDLVSVCTAYPNFLSNEKLGCDVLALPFPAATCSYDPEKEVDPLNLITDITTPNRPLLVISHFTIPGIQPGEETTDMPRGRDVLYPFAGIEKLAKVRPVVCANGHYHKRQIFQPKEMSVPIYLPGTPIQFNHGEATNKPGFMVLEVRDA